MTTDASEPSGAGRGWPAANPSLPLIYPLPRAGLGDRYKTQHACFVHLCLTVLLQYLLPQSVTARMEKLKEIQLFIIMIIK